MKNIVKNKKDFLDLVPVILAGGVGERLWPISRYSRPKQFAEIFDKTLFEKTLDRAKALNSIYNPIVITNYEYRFIVTELCKKNKTKIDSIILEPIPKNTAPAFLLASLNVLKKFGNKNILFMPSDHILKDDRNFTKLIKKSIIHLNNENIITFGVQPKEKNSEYGYIEINQKKISSTAPHSVKRFIEKPKNKLLDKIHSNKNCFWNSGIYFCKASVIDQLTLKFNPILYDLTTKAFMHKKTEFGYDLVNNRYFKKIKPISIDYAVMEHADNLLLFKFDSIWSDLGSWKSIDKYVKKDKDLNFKKGNVVFHKSKNSMVFSESRLCVLSNVEELIVIDCRDVLFITNKNEGSDQVKELIQFLSNKNKKEVLEYPIIKRPWGFYEVFIVGQNYLVKKISIKPKSSISLQKHRFRSEHWVVVSGKGKFYLADDIYHIKTNESIYIPKGKKHKIENIGKNDLIIVEVQTGSHLSEDDIIRYSDNYGRV